MEMTWLEDFLALASSCSFSRAADARGVTQPAFSRRIRSLETWLGVVLVNRDTHRIELTGPGVRLVEIAGGLLRNLELGRLELQEMADVARASVRFAVTHALSLTFFPQWIGALQAEQADEIPLHLTADNMCAAEQLMLMGKVQFLLCHHHPAAASVLEQRGFSSVVLSMDELIPVSAPGEGGGSLHVLPGTPGRPASYLKYGAESGIGRIVTSSRLAGAPSAYLAPVFTSHAAMVLAAMARDRRGLAWLPRSLIQNELAARTLVPAGGKEWSIAVDVRMYRAHTRQSPAAEAFWSLMLKQERSVAARQPLRVA